MAAVEPASDVARRAGDAKVVAYAGRLIEGKGLSDLFESFAALGGEPLLCIVGDGPLRAGLEAHAVRLGIADRVWFRGLLSLRETLAVLRAADVVVSPSYTEGLPTTVLEAALLGRAVVATNVGGTAEIVSDERSALLYPPRDVGALTRALRRLLDDAALRAALGDAARQQAAARFSWSACAEAFAIEAADLVSRSRD